MKTPRAALRRTRDTSSINTKRCARARERTPRTPAAKIFSSRPPLSSVAHPRVRPSPSLVVVTQNASLVLTSDRSERVTGEPSGAPETLWGRIEPGAFGDRAHRSRPAELDERMKKSKEKRKNAAGGMDQDDLDAYAAKRKRRGTERASVLDAEADGSYRPKTRETRAAYEALLGMIQQQFGDQPRDVLRGAAEEVLEVLKDDASNDPKRKSDVEKLMGPTSDESFARMVAVGKLVTDFKPGGAGDDAADAAGDALDDDIGVAVEFEEEDEETDNEVDEVLEASDVEEEEEGEEAEAGAGVGVAGAAGAAAGRRGPGRRGPPPRRVLAAAPDRLRVWVHGRGGERVQQDRGGGAGGAREREG